MIDVETTGLSPKSERIIELAVVQTDRSGNVIGEWVTRFNPEGPVGATHIHGITDADVRDAPRFAHLLTHVSSRLAGRAIVAHNANFDLAFLRSEYRRAGWTLPWLPSLCTLQASRVYLPHLERRRLNDCCAACDLEHLDAHSALGDARATAALLSAYLSSRHGVSVLDEHANLPNEASQVVWPSSPEGGDFGLQPSSRRRYRTTSKPTPTRLAKLVQNFALQDALDEEATDGSLPYLELLAKALEDGVLSIDEAEALHELAVEYDLSRDTVSKAHQGFLLALAHLALDDGRVTQGERAELNQMAEVLGVPATRIKSLLDKAEAARQARMSEGLIPLPGNWTLGEPLRVGDRVVFTGCDEAQRTRLEAKAEKLGVRVMTSVSGRTTMLVTDGSVQGTKARAARERDTRTVSPDTFATLLQHLQPSSR